MAGSFDPYYTWLGIPPEEQPPNHYRLLGIREFEENLDAIGNAADQRMTHLRTFQTGRHSKLSQWMLNEVAAARVCLFDAERKAAYDKALRQTLKGSQQTMPLAPPSAPPQPPPVPPPAGPIAITVNRRGSAWADPIEEGAPRPAGDAAPTAQTPAQAAATPATNPDRWMKRLILAGSATVVLLVLLLTVSIVVLRIRSKGRASGETALVLDWPEEQRRDLKLLIDGNLHEFPASGPLLYPCRPGKHRVRGLRPWYRPYEEIVDVRPGEQKQVEAKWSAEPCLVLRLSAEERDANVEIDGKFQNLWDRPHELRLDEVRFKLEPGKHHVRIIRMGFKTVEEDIEIVDGQAYTLKPEWQPEGGPGNASEKSPAPIQIEQREIGERIDRDHGVANATTAEQKRALAGKLFDLARQTQHATAEKYVLLRKATELAGDGGDVKLVFQACAAIGAQFSGDLSDLKRQTLARLVDSAGAAPPLAAVPDPDDQVAIGDVYWDRAEKGGVAGRNALLLSAAPWYRQAQPKVTAKDVKERLAARLEEIKKLEDALAVIKVAAKAGEEEARKARTEAEQAMRRQSDYAKKLKPAEDLVAAWDFRGAAEALKKIQFADDEQALSDRLAVRRGEVDRMAALKARIIEKINEVSPRLKRSDLMLKGSVPGEVVADEQAITVKLTSGNDEPHAWREVNEKALRKLVPLAVDQGRASDWLAAGLLALVCKDPKMAEQWFHQAQSQGAKIGPHQSSLVAMLFGLAGELIEKGEFDKADAALANLAKNYAATDWFTANAKVVDGARAKIKVGLRDIEAELVYKEAAEAFKRKELFELKPLVDKLSTDYATTRAVIDPERKPTVADMHGAVAKLGKRLTVCRFTKADFVTVQEAINAAMPDSLIEIQDSGVYNEKLLVEKEKEGLTIRGKKGCWPIITSSGERSNFARLLEIQAPRVTIERLVLAHGSAAGDGARCLDQHGGTFLIRSSIVYGNDVNSCELRGPTEVDTCFLIGRKAEIHGPITSRDSLWFGDDCWRDKTTLENVLTGGKHDFTPRSQADLKYCTIAGHLKFEGQPNALADCIVRSVEALLAGTQIDRCDVYDQKSPYIDYARPRKDCLNLDPQFTDAKRFDFRLLATSPCRKKASDGGDLGFRYARTPELVELLKQAEELRARGVIRF